MKALEQLRIAMHHQTIQEGPTSCPQQNRNKLSVRNSPPNCRINPRIHKDKKDPKIRLQATNLSYLQIACDFNRNSQLHAGELRRKTPQRQDRQVKFILIMVLGQKPAKKRRKQDVIVFEVLRQLADKSNITAQNRVLIALPKKLQRTLTRECADPSKLTSPALRYL